MATGLAWTSNGGALLPVEVVTMPGKGHLMVTRSPMSRPHRRCRVATLSKVENGRLSLTYDKLVASSEGLRVDIAALFSRRPAVSTRPMPGVTARRSITRQREGLRSRRRTTITAISAPTSRTRRWCRS